MHRVPLNTARRNPGLNRHLFQRPNDLLHPLSAPPPEMEVVVEVPGIEAFTINQELLTSLSISHPSNTKEIKKVIISI